MKTPAIASICLVIAFASSSCVVEVPNTTGSSSAAASSGSETSPPPVVQAMPNGDIHVVFQSGCRCIFDSKGTLKSGGQGCDDVDLHRARVAVRAHLAEQSSDFLDV